MSAEQLATRILAEQAEISSVRHPARQHPREPVRPAGRCLEHDVDDAALYRRHRRPVDQPARGAGPAAQAAEGARPHRHRLHPAALRLVAESQREPGAGADRDHDDAQGAGQGARGADHRARPAQPRGRTARRQASPACRPSRTPARSSRMPTWCSSSIARSTTSRTRSPRKGTPEHLNVAGRDGEGAWPRRSDHRQAAPRSHRHGAA